MNKVVSLPRVDAQQPHRQMAGIVESLPRERDILVHCKAGGSLGHISPYLPTSPHGTLQIYTRTHARTHART